ncbi:Ktr system potassium uptake protein A [Poriferisphaera corsica]|uniref:Ktr system potassium uptake protein A n=1 Tax=Poriferisphaera corsica TaxID=2528020 RepID=A0A517YW37_9BACT|nr:TrkA family potassium uptake protein [Poriferisphaera corsica]QDU34435.1 Ktr system potassium uptake protein A [Poriferisphaera corsica]
MHRFAVIGLGRFGSRLAANLAASGHEVIGIDRDPALIEDMRDRVTLAIALDATDEQALLSQGVDKVDIAIVGIGNNFEAIALTTVVLKQLGVPRVISRAVTPTSAKILAKIGADEVVNPEDESADRWANRLITPQFRNHLELDAQHSIVEIQTPEAWRGHNLIELNLRAEYNVHVVAIKRRKPEQSELTPPSVMIPDPTSGLREEDILVIMGADKDLAKIVKK